MMDKRERERTDKLAARQLLEQEVWYQDADDTDLWVNAQGLIVNTAALSERADFFQVLRVPQPSAPKDDPAPVRASQ